MAPKITSKLSNCKKCIKLKVANHLAKIHISQIQFGKYKDMFSLGIVGISQMYTPIFTDYLCPWENKQFTVTKLLAQTLSQFTNSLAYKLTKLHSAMGQWDG